MNSKAVVNSYVTTTPDTNNDDSMIGNTTQQVLVISEMETAIELITYICAGVSIASILLTLVSYIGYRKFNVKRPHIIMVNLCVCLLVYFTSYVISNPSRHLVALIQPNHQVEILCTLGAFLCHLSLLSTWLWLTAYWFILLIMYKKPVGGHISHFVFKSALPCYGIPILFAVTTILIAHARHDIRRPEDQGYASNACFIANNYLYIGLVVPFFISCIPVVMIFVIVICGLCNVKSEQETTQLQQKLNGMRRVKSHLIKLSVITFLTALLVLDSAVIPVVRQMHSENKVLSLAIMFSAISIGLGILLLYLFCIRQEDIRDYWVDMVLGSKSSFRNRSFNHQNIVSGSRKRRSLGRNNESYRLHSNSDVEKTRSGYKIIPKQDTDLTTLNLEQIPVSSTPQLPTSSTAVTSSGDHVTSAVIKTRTQSSTSATSGRFNKAGNKSRIASTTSSKHDDVIVTTTAPLSDSGCRTMPRCEKNDVTASAAKMMTSCVSLSSSRDSTLEVTEFI